MKKRQLPERPQKWDIKMCKKRGFPTIIQYVRHLLAVRYE